MTEKIKTNPRRAAFDSLRKIEESGRYSNLEIDSTLEKSEMSQADRGLYTRLVYGVTERRLTLDYIISQYSRMSADKLDHETRRVSDDVHGQNSRPFCGKRIRGACVEG